MQRYRPLPNLRLEIVGIVPALPFAHLAPGHARVVVRPREVDALAVARLGDEHLEHVGVVNGHNPRHPERRTFSERPDGRDAEDVGRDPLDQALEHAAVLEGAHRRMDDAGFSRDEFHLWNGGQLGIELGARKGRVQHVHVQRIHEVVAEVQPAEGHDGQAVVVGGAPAAERCVVELPGCDVFQDVVARQRRFLVQRTHVRKHQPVALFYWVPRLANLDDFASRLERLLKAAALGVVQPAVVAAADAALFDLSVAQGRSAVHATRVQQAGLARAVAKEDQVLAQDAHFLRAHTGEIRGRGDRMPVAPEHFAARRPSPDLGQERVGCRGRAAIGTAFGVHRDIHAIHAIYSLETNVNCV